MKKQTPTSSSKVVIVTPPIKDGAGNVSIKSQGTDYIGTEDTEENDEIAGDTPAE